jgi:hypothetical protein
LDGVEKVSWGELPKATDNMPDMTTEEKLQAIYEAGVYFYLKTFDEYQDGFYIEAASGIDGGDFAKFYSIRDAVDWLYENTVGNG